MLLAMAVLVDTALTVTIMEELATRRILFIPATSRLGRRTTSANTCASVAMASSVATAAPLTRTTRSICLTTIWSAECYGRGVDRPIWPLTSWNIVHR